MNAALLVRVDLPRGIIAPSHCHLSQVLRVMGIKPYDDKLVERFMEEDRLVHIQAFWLRRHPILTTMLLTVLAVITYLALSVGAASGVMTIVGLFTHPPGFLLRPLVLFASVVSAVAALVLHVAIEEYCHDIASRRWVTTGYDHYVRSGGSVPDRVRECVTSIRFLVPEARIEVKALGQDPVLSVRTVHEQFYIDQWD